VERRTGRASEGERGEQVARSSCRDVIRVIPDVCCTARRAKGKGRRRAVGTRFPVVGGGQGRDGGAWRRGGSRGDA